MAIRNYTIDSMCNDILILLRNKEISDSQMIESIKLFIKLIKHMRKNGELK